MIKVTGEIYGDWDRLDRILKSLQRNRREYHDVIMDVGEEIADRIKELISSGSLNLEPLVAEYRAQKLADGYGDTILVRTGDYVNSIQVVDIEPKGYDMDVFISVGDGMTRTGISMQELAEFLEYGTSKMTGREPFKKSWEEMKSDIIAEVEQRLTAIIKEDLRK